MLTTTDQTQAVGIRGRVGHPGDDDWDAGRQAFTLLVDQRPADEIALFAFGLVLDPASGAALQGTLIEISRICAPARVGACPSSIEEPTDASTFFNAVTWVRLREVKALYDPRDRYRGNHHVPPAC